MEQEPLRSIVIVGGGVAGWMTAAMLARQVLTDRCRIELIEIEPTEPFGDGTASIPAIHDFNRRLGIDERDFMAATRATFKLGSQFVNWGAIGDSYMHPFGTHGIDMNGVEFHHYWLQQRLDGDDTPFDDYALACLAARQRRFRHPETDRRSVNSTYFYAFHFEVSLYAALLRQTAEDLGVVCTAARIDDVELHQDNGHIAAVVLDGGRRIEGEFFIDCSGFRGILIEQALKTGYEDWRHWLPCDRALSVSSSCASEPDPYTQVTAYPTGWQWQIPLQHRIASGHVFSAAFTTAEKAVETLQGNLAGEPQTDPCLHSFVPGKRRQMWHGNCVAIGAAGGLLEPLESTSIFLIQAAIMKLVEFFPDRRIAPQGAAAFNRSMDRIFAEVRNFIILHYKQTARTDSRFWRYCKAMRIPEELEFRMRLFKERGVATQQDNELFNATNWIAVCLGQNLIPQHLDPRVNCLDADERRTRLANLRQNLVEAADAMPSHAAALKQYSAAPLTGGKAS